jgi:hypothetical protein
VVPAVVRQPPPQERLGGRPQTAPRAHGLPAAHRQRGPRRPLDRLRRLRDEHFAHALVGLPTKGCPRYGWLWDLYRDTAPIVADLHFALTGNANLDEHEADARANAEAFWNAARRGMVELRRERD